MLTLDPSTAAAHLHERADAGLAAALSAGCYTTSWTGDDATVDLASCALASFPASLTGRITLSLTLDTQVNLAVAMTAVNVDDDVYDGSLSFVVRSVEQAGNELTGDALAIQTASASFAVAVHGWVATVPSPTGVLSTLSVIVLPDLVTYEGSGQLT